MNTRSFAPQGSCTCDPRDSARSGLLLCRLDALLAISLLTACGGAYRSGDSVDGVWVDRRLSRFSYVNEGVGATVIVGTKATRLRENEAFVPLEIAVANTGDKSLRLIRDAFTLVDVHGGRYKPATPRELLKGYAFLDMDRSPALSELTSVAASAFSAHRPHRSKFSPTRDVEAAGRFTRKVVLDETALPPFGYVVDFLYFPTPIAGIMGQRFDLTLEAAALLESVTVSFLVK